jgi:hypothetical protein
MAQFIELNLDQGTDFDFDMELTNDDGTRKNIEGYEFSSSIRKSYYSTNVTANLTPTIVDAENGIITFSLSADATANVKPGRYLFDIKQVDSSNLTSRIVEGLIIVNPQITK